MSFTIGLFHRYNGTNNNQKFSDTQWNQIEASLNILTGNTAISSFFDSLSGLSAINIQRDPSSKPEAYWLQNGSSINLSNTVFSSLTYFDPAGVEFAVELERIIFHELVHAKYSDTSSLVDYKVAYQREQRSVFLENAFFSEQFGGKERVGHGYVPGNSASAISYLHDMQLQEPGLGSVFTFKFGSDTIKKDYNSFNRNVTASTTYKYDNYIPIKLQSENQLLSQDGNIANDRLSGILSNSSATNGFTSLKVAASAAVSAVELAAQINDVHFLYGSTGTVAPIFSTFSLDQRTAISVSAEAYGDKYDNGPVRFYHGASSANTTAAPDTLAVVNDSSAGALIFGGSGYLQNGVDMTGSGDDLKGGQGNDILMAGNAAADIINVLFAGDGSDILVGGTGSDHLIGGDGSDLFVGGGEADIMDGGAGYDVLSYASSGIGVTIDFRIRGNDRSQDLKTTVGLLTGGVSSDATGDKITNIEAIIGSDHDDTMFADGGNFTGTQPHGLVLYGGAGNDNLYGENGDILIGGSGDDDIVIGQLGFGRVSLGEGADRLYILGDSPSRRVIIVGNGDSSDTLYWNGWQISNDAETTLIDREVYEDEDGGWHDDFLIENINSQGLRFSVGFYEGNMDLSLTAPDGITTILLDDWENGDYGLTLGQREINLYNIMDQIDVNSLSQTELCYDGVSSQDSTVIFDLERSRSYTYQSGDNVADFM